MYVKYSLAVSATKRNANIYITSEPHIFFFKQNRKYFYFICISRKFIPKDLIPLLEEIGGAIEKYIPSPYAGEIIGIAKAVDAKVGDIVMANLIYDVTAYVQKDEHFVFIMYLPAHSKIIVY